MPSRFVLLLCAPMAAAFTFGSQPTRSIQRYLPVAASTAVASEPAVVDTKTFSQANLTFSEPNPQQPPDPRSPAEIENEKFVCDETVEYWRNFQRSGLETAQQNIQNVAAVLSRLSKTPEGTEYLVRHTARTGYFASNAILGTLGFRLYDMLVNNDNSGSVFDNLYREPAIASRIFLESFLCYEQDYQRVSKKMYSKPYDMYTSNRQSSPLYVATQSARFVRESIGTLGRRKRPKDEYKWVSPSKYDTSPSIYPDYYRTAFHYQTDGWMSQDSAAVYETSTETLFLGRQDAMQRTALPPLTSLAKQVKNRPMKVLEVACGTGRFMTFARDSLPLDTEYVATDLSPFYLDAARDNDANWRSIRKRKEAREGKPNAVISPAGTIQAKAEDLPFDDDEFDTVVCIYLFHELPRAVRAQAAAEMARVVRPGGKVVFTDSVQLGDRPVFDESMPNFSHMNEPYYNDYIADSLHLHFENAGLKCLDKTVCSSTKTLSFLKE